MPPLVVRISSRCRCDSQKGVVDRAAAVGSFALTWPPLTASPVAVVCFQCIHEIIDWLTCAYSHFSDLTAVRSEKWSLASSDCLIAFIACTNFFGVVIGAEHDRMHLVLAKHIISVVLRNFSLPPGFSVPPATICVDFRKTGLTSQVPSLLMFVVPQLKSCLKLIRIRFSVSGRSKHNMLHAQVDT